MSNDPPAEPDQDESWWARFQDSFEGFKNKKKTISFVFVVLAGTLAVISDIRGSGVLPFIGGLLESLNLAILALVGACLMLVAGLFISRSRGKLIILIVGFVLCLPLVTQFRSMPRRDNLVIVFDEPSRTMFPRNVNEQTVDIDDIAKLAETREVTSGSLILSLVERPAEAWRPIFQSGFEPQLKILSLREVLDSESDVFVDISSSDYMMEIEHAMRSETQGSGSIVIYVTGSYIEFASQLEQLLQDELPNASVTLTAYRSRRTGLYHPEDAVLAYLGSADDFADFFRHVSTTDYSQLVAPNWVAGEIQIPTRPSLTAGRSPAGGRGVLAISSPALRLAAADSTQWFNVINAVREARQEQADVGSHVGNRLSRGMTIEMISFGYADLRR